jgi:hypothetical protein
VLCHDELQSVHVVNCFRLHRVTITALLQCVSPASTRIKPSTQCIDVLSIELHHHPHSASITSTPTTRSRTFYPRPTIHTSVRDPHTHHTLPSTTNATQRCLSSPSPSPKPPTSPIPIPSPDRLPKPKQPQSQPKPKQRNKNQVQAAATEATGLTRYLKNTTARPSTAAVTAAAYSRNAPVH